MIVGLNELHFLLSILAIYSTISCIFKTQIKLNVYTEFALIMKGSSTYYYFQQCKSTVLPFKCLLQGEESTKHNKTETVRRQKM